LYLAWELNNCESQNDARQPELIATSNPAANLNKPERITSRGSTRRGQLRKQQYPD
jgi:hypothetical protein